MTWAAAFATVGVAFAFAWVFVTLIRSHAASTMFGPQRHDYESTETTVTDKEDA